MYSGEKAKDKSLRSACELCIGYVTPLDKSIVLEQVKRTRKGNVSPHNLVEQSSHDHTEVPGAPVSMDGT